MIKLIELEINGNKKTYEMHFYTLHEINKMHLLGDKKIKKIRPEEIVLIEKEKNKGKKIKAKGSFDFLVEDLDGKIIGIEILTRPTLGKMKHKLCYAKDVDEFIFVIPEGSLEKYYAKNSPYKTFCRQSIAPLELKDEKIKIWLFNLEKKKFSRKAKARDLLCFKNSKR